MKQYETAFPVTTDNGSNNGMGGMLMRDYIAVRAMHQFLHRAVIPQGLDARDAFKQVAARAYEIADAMLKESEKAK